MSLKIPCISIYQPWSELIVAGIKPIENRTRISNYRGPLLIHAAKKFDAKWEEGLDEVTKKIALDYLKTVCSFPTSLIKGCIVGFVIQTGCIGPLNVVEPICNSPWYEIGGYGLVMEHPVKLSTPIPYIGRQGMFKADVAGQIKQEDAIRIVSQIGKWGSM